MDEYISVESFQSSYTPSSSVGFNGSSTEAFLNFGLVEMNLALWVILLAVPNGDTRDRISSQERKKSRDGLLKNDTDNE